jgi:multimeric flavodoxin WrbA
MSPDAQFTLYPPGEHTMTVDTTRRHFLSTAGVALMGTAATAVAGESTKSSVAGPIRIIAISGSMRKGKTTAAALQLCLDAAKEVSPQIEVELIELAGLKIDASVAAGIEPPAGERDDFVPLIPKLVDPRVRGIIVGSPVYFGSMTSLCKAFIERCSAFRKDYAWSNKVAGVLAVGGARNSGQELTIQCLQAALMSFEMILVGDGRPTCHRGATLWNASKEEGISKDEWGQGTAKNLGRRVAEVVLATACPSR